VTPAVTRAPRALRLTPVQRARLHHIKGYVRAFTDDDPRTRAIADAAREAARAVYCAEQAYQSAVDECVEAWAALDRHIAAADRRHGSDR
jgi:hypothetical protein